MEGWLSQAPSQRQAVESVPGNRLVAAARVLHTGVGLFVDRPPGFCGSLLRTIVRRPEHISCSGRGNITFMGISWQLQYQRLDWVCSLPHSVDGLSQ